MNDKEKIKRITELLNDLHLLELTKQEFDEEFLKMSINDLMDEMWRLYCFTSDVCNTLNEVEE